MKNDNSYIYNLIFGDKHKEKLIENIINKLKENPDNFNIKYENNQNIFDKHEFIENCRDNSLKEALILNQNSNLFYNLLLSDTGIGGIRSFLNKKTNRLLCYIYSQLNQKTKIIPEILLVDKNNLPDNIKNKIKNRQILSIEDIDTIQNNIINQQKYIIDNSYDTLNTYHLSNPFHNTTQTSVTPYITPQTSQTPQTPQTPLSPLSPLSPISPIFSPSPSSLLSQTPRPSSMPRLSMQQSSTQSPAQFLTKEYLTNEFIKSPLMYDDFVNEMATKYSNRNVKTITDIFPKDFGEQYSLFGSRKTSSKKSKKASKKSKKQKKIKRIKRSIKKI